MSQKLLSGVHMITQYTSVAVFFSASSAFNNPSPPERVIMDCASNFVTAIQASLHCGTIRNCSFSVLFCTDVFKFLFSSKGVVTSGRRGRSL